MLPKYLIKDKKWSLKNFQRYSRVRTADDGDEDSPDSKEMVPTLRSLWKLFITLYVMGSSCLIVFLILKTYIPWRPDLLSHPHDTIQVAPCGNTSTQALEKGCQFDIISFSWLPDQCYDSELAAEFKGLTDWAYYLDRNKTQPISQELALTGQFAGLFTEFEYHLRHCTYLWKKMHRALLLKGKGAIDSVTGGYAHTEHCAHMLMTRREVNLDVVNAVIMVKFPDCGIA